MNLTNKLTIHLDDNRILPAVPAVQGDTARFVEVSLYAGEQAWKIPDQSEIVIRYRRSDGAGGTYNTLEDGSPAWSVSENTVTVALDPVVLAVPHKTAMQIAVKNGDAIISTFSFVVNVQADPSVGAYAPGKPSKGGNCIFTVTYTDNEDEYQRIDKTFDEIRAAIDSGKTVECIYDWYTLPLLYDGRINLVFSCFVHQALMRVVVTRDSGAYYEYIPNVTLARGLRIVAGDDYAFIDGAFPITNSDLLEINGVAAPEMLPYVTLNIGGADTPECEICLPYIGWTTRDVDDGGITFYYVYTFSQTLQPGEGREKAMRYTVNILVEVVNLTVDPDGEPLIEYSVEELDRENTDGSYSLPIASPETLGGVMPVAKTADMTQSVGVDKNGRLFTAPVASGGDSSPEGSGNTWRHLDTFDLSSGAVSYEIDTTGCSEIMLLTTESLTCSAGSINWKQFPYGTALGMAKLTGGVTHLRYIGDGVITVQKPRGDTDTLQASAIVLGVTDTNNTLLLSFSTVTSGTIVVYGR